MRIGAVCAPQKGVAPSITASSFLGAILPPIAIAITVSCRYHRPLNAEELRIVEGRLAGGDALLLSAHVYGIQACTIGDHLRILLGRVIAGRIRAEERERREQDPPQIH